MNDRQIGYRSYILSLLFLLFHSSSLWHTAIDVMEGWNAYTAISAPFPPRDAVVAANEKLATGKKVYLNPTKTDRNVTRTTYDGQGRVSLFTEATGHLTITILSGLLT